MKSVRSGALCAFAALFAIANPIGNVNARTRQAVAVLPGGVIFVIFLTAYLPVRAFSVSSV